MDTTSPNSMAGRLARLEARIGELDRELHDESLPHRRRLDATCAAFEFRRQAQRLRDSAGVPTAERLFAAADGLANARGAHSRFTRMLEADAALLATLTDGLSPCLDIGESAQGDVQRAWRDGFEQALRMVRDRLATGPTDL